jgi:hypothetical protein
MSTNKDKINIICQIKLTLENMRVVAISNLRVKCDKHPANYCVIFYDSEVLSVFNFVVGACALRE